MCFWEQTGSTVIPPPSLVEVIENRKGTKPKPKRKKGKNKSPTKKKVSRGGRVMHCSRCGGEAHNVTKCPGVGAPKKKTQTQENEQDFMNCDDFAGPSQATQE